MFNSAKSFMSRHPVCRRVLASGAMLIAFIGVAQPGWSDSFARPADREWPAFGGDWGNTRYSTLKQIRVDNVRKLGAVWTRHFEGASSVAAPVIANGMMFITAGPNVVALDPKTGATLWSYRAKVPPSRKGVAVGEGLVFAGLSDTTLIALTQKTGELVWSTFLGDENFKGVVLGQGKANPTSLGLSGQNISAPAAYVKGKVIVGLGNGDFGLRGSIVAVDAKTGKIAWRFHTIPAPGEFGHDTWPKDSDVWTHGGGGVWMVPAVDADLGLVYLGVGNPVPQWGGEAREGDNLFTCAVVALDIETGERRWHYQFVRHDVWDHDLGTPLVLFDTIVDGKKRKGLAVMRTDGYLFQLDRETGAPLRPIEDRPVPQSARLKTAATQPFPVGAEGIGPRCVEKDMVPAGFKLLCYFDVFDYHEPNVMMPLLTTRAAPMSYNPDTGYFYATASVAPYWVRRAEDPYYFQVQTTAGMKNYGLIAAVDSRTGKIAWQRRTPNRIEAGSGAMTTAGGLLFHGEPNGQLQAYDAKTGDLLWEFQTGAAADGPVSTYAIDGEQYIVVAAGDVWAFKLGGTLAQRPAPPPRPTETKFTGRVHRTDTIRIGAPARDMGLTGLHEIHDEFAFEPLRVRVAKGSPISWVNAGQQTHTIRAQDGSWSTGPIAPGETKQIAIEKPGTYIYTCVEHPWSYAELIVQ